MVSGKIFSISGQKYPFKIFLIFFTVATNFKKYFGTVFWGDLFLGPGDDLVHPNFGNRFGI